MNPRVWRFLVAVGSRLLLGNDLPVGVVGAALGWMAVVCIVTMVPAPGRNNSGGPGA